MSELQLRRAILYKTGIGFFEKLGKIDFKKDQKVNLSFKSKIMNDLLKTFSISKLKGNFAVGGISYESENSNQSKLLEDSVINLPEQDTLTALLLQLRGLEIKLTVNGKKIQGTIVGLQSRIDPVGDKSNSTISEIFTLIREESGNLTSMKLKDIIDLEIIDNTARNDFKFFIDVIQSTKKEKNRNVAIFLTPTDKMEANSEASFLLTFLCELPAWKASYRLFIVEEGKEKKSVNKKEDTEQQLKIFLQGWAIIDNVLDEDWKDVNLSLISGLPISFNYDSYSPLWITRPTIERNQNLNIPTSTSGRADSFDFPTKGMRDSPKSMPAEIDAKDTSQVVNKVVQGTPIKGSGFEYKIRIPVNVKRNQSSLIPLLQSEGSALLVSIFNENAMPVNPMLALEFKNTTDLSLEEGPISIFKDNIFEGEAVLPFMEKNEQQRIPFAIDQGMEIHPKNETNRKKYHEIRIRQDIIQKYYQENIKTYSIRNITELEKTLIIEHPKEDGYELYDSIEPSESSARFYRFRLQLKAESSEKLVIKTRKVLSDTFSLNRASRDGVAEWLLLKLISKEDADFLISNIEYREKIAQIDQQIYALQNKKGLFSTEHNRIRNNLDVLSDSNEIDKKLRQRYVAKLEKQEAEIDQIEQQISKLQAEKERILKQQNEFVMDFAFK